MQISYTVRGQSFDFECDVTDRVTPRSLAVAALNDARRRGLDTELPVYNDDADAFRRGTTVRIKPTQELVAALLAGSCRGLWTQEQLRRELES